MDELLDAIFSTIVFIVMAIVYIIFLAFDAVIDWFQDYERYNQMDTNEIGFTIIQALNDPDTPRVSNVFAKRNANAQYATVQGIFDRDTQRVSTARKVESNSVDSRLAAAHRSKPVVLYE